MTDDDAPQPRFRKGLDGLRQAMDEHEIKFVQDLILIRHRIDEAGWPPAATKFVHRVLEYFPDPDDDVGDDWPDWGADEVLGFIVHDLADALEARS